MEQNAVYNVENSRKSNKYYRFIKKTILQFVVPVSLVSFLLSYSSCFPFFFTYNFHFSTLVFPIFAHALERKYMFLICNGILAFLVKTLSFNSSPLPVSDVNDHEYSIKFNEVISEENVANAQEQEKYGTLMKVAHAGQEEEVYAAPEKTALEEDKLDQGKANEEVNVSSTAEDEEIQGGAFVIDSEDLETSEVEEEEEDMEEGGDVLASSAAEIEVNINTEELNQKFEEFIRKMKEEIRIQAQQQLITE